MVDLSSLTFGAPAAERDIDQGLEAYFVDTEAFRKVRAGSKTIILGNRGAGKSAIFRVMAARERAAGAVIVELAPEDYSYEMLARVLESERSGSWAKLGAYAVAWKYLLLIEVMKGLVKQGISLKGRQLAVIKRFLRDNVRSYQGNPIQALISYLKRMEGIKFGPYEAALRVRELDRLYKLDELRPFMADIEELCSRQRVVVLVDELDKGWDASEDAQAFVAGLFQACTGVNRQIPSLTVCMSLRKELYDSIPALYDDAQKYRDLIQEISWDEVTLLRLMAERIRYSAKELHEASDDEAWNVVFGETLQYRGTRSFNYMVDRTLYRPRELISYATEALDAAVDRRQWLPLDYDVLSQAEVEYSTERTKDIAAEYRFQYPGLLSVFETFRGSVHTLDRERLETIGLELCVGERKIDEQASWVKDQDPEAIIEVLWRVGFLRAQAVGGVKARQRGGSSYLGPHQVANLNLRNVQRFQVHPMFRAYLGTKEPKGRGA
jgi:hypothetical protein